MENNSLPQPDKYQGWKILAGYVVLFAGVTVSYTVWAVGIRFISLRLGIPQGISITLNRLGGIAISIGASAVASHSILKHRLGSLAFQRHPGWWSDLFFGALLSTVAMVSIFTILTGNDWLITQSWRWQTVSSGIWAGILWNSILINAYASVGEEAIFRGYLLSGLKEAWGKTIGLAVVSVIFAAMHLGVGTAEQTPVPLFILSLVRPGLC